MANYKTGLIITGDASGGIRAIKATDDELGKLNKNFDRGSRQSKRFGTDAQRAGRQLSEIDQGASDASRGLALLRTNVAGVAAAMATAFGAGSVINQARIIADTDALAKSIGVATGQLQAWDYAAQQMGMSGGQIGDILKDITERIGEFSAEGTGEAAALFENLNLNIAEMERLAPDQQLLKIADAISTLETRGEKISYLERLGNDATRLLPLLDDNAALLREYSAEAEALGVSMSRVDINNAVEANRAMRQLGGTMEGFTNQIVADLGPGIAEAVGGLTDFIQEMGGAEVILTNVKDVATLTAAVMAGRYAASFASSTKQLIEKNAASAAAVVAEERTLQMAVRRAAAEATAEKRLLGRAVAEERATRGTDAHTAALARLNVARSRSIAAATEHTAAVNANTAATQRSAVAARAASSAYALIGGPLGVATLAATAFFMFRDSSDEVADSLVSLDQPLESVIEDFKELTRNQQQASMARWGERQAEEADKASEAFSRLRRDVLDETFSSLSFDDRFAFFDELSAAFEDVESGAVELYDVLEMAGERAGIPPEVMNSWYRQAGAYDEHNQGAQRADAVLEELRDTFSDVGNAAENTGSQVEDNAPSSEAIEKWEKYNQKLRESVAALQDPSATGAASRELDNLGIEDPIRRATTLVLAAQQDQIERQKELQKEAADAARQAASDAKNAAQEQARAAEQQANALQSVQEEMDPLLADHQTYKDRLDVLNTALTDGTITQEAYGEAVRWSAEQYSRAATGAEDYEKQTERLIDQYDSHNQKAQQLRDAVDAINERYRAGEISGDQYTRMIGGVRDEMRELALEADPMAQEMARAWEEASNRIDETFADAFTGAFDSFDDFGDQLLDSFKRLLGELAYQATLKPIVVNFTGQMQGVMGVGGKAPGGMSAGGFDIGSLGSLKNGWDTVSGFLGGGSAASTAAAGYTGALGAATATGYGGAVGSAVSGAASAGGGLMGAASAAMPWVAGGMLVDEVLGLGIVDGIVSGISGLFGSSPTPFSGRFGTTGSLNASSEGGGQDGVFEHQGGGRFYGQSALGYVGFRDRGTERLQRAGTGSKDWAEELTDAAVEMDNLVASLASSPRELQAMQSAVQGLETSSSSAADIIDFALKDRPRAAIEAMSGDFGRFVQTLSGGIEEVVQQAQAAQQAYSTVTQGLDRINVEFGVTGSAAYTAASEIAEFSGGLEQFSDRAQFYYENFITEAEKQERAMDAAARSMGVFTARTGRVVTTTDQLRDLVDGLNLNTSAGRELYAAAMELAPALVEVEAGLERVRDRFSDMISTAESAADSAAQQARSAWQTFDSQSYDQQRQLLDLMGNSQAALALERERELATIDEALRPTQERIWAIQDEAEAVNNYASALESASGWLESTLDNIAGWVDERRATSGAPAENLQETQSQFARQLTLAEAGDRDALQSITEYADRYLASASEYYASGDGYQSVESDVMDAISALPDVLSPEDYIAQDIKDALEESENLSSLPDLKNMAGEQLSALNALMAEMRNSTDQFVSLDSNMISLRDSINALGVAREEVARIERERAAAEKAERERLERLRQETAQYESQRRALLENQSELQDAIAATEGSASLERWQQQVAELNNSGGTRAAVEAAFENAASHLDFTAPASEFNDQLNAIIADFRQEGSMWSAEAYDPVARILRAEALVDRREDALAEIERQLAQLKRPDGSHADGNWNVAFDGYLAELHKGEMVVPAEQAAQLRNLPSRGLPMPDMPLPQFPALGSNDVLQVLQDVKKELAASRAENKRLLERIGDNTGDTVKAVSGTATKAEQQRAAQIKEQQRATAASKLKVRNA